MTVKELIKELMSRKFAIAFIGILSLYLIAKIPTVQISAETPLETVFDIGDPNEPQKAEIETKSDWKIPTYILLITCFTVGCQTWLDYCKFKSPAKPENTQKP